MNGYAELEKRFNAEAEGFTNRWLQKRKDAHGLVYRGRGERFSDLLLQVSSVPDENLSRVLSTALRSDQADLAQAVGMEAFERGHFGVFRDHAASHPTVARSLELLNKTPGYDQLIARTHKAMGPPRADADALIPGIEEKRWAARQVENDQGRRNLEEFYGGPTVRRIVGRRTDEVRVSGV